MYFVLKYRIPKLINMLQVVTVVVGRMNSRPIKYFVLK